MKRELIILASVLLLALAGVCLAQSPEEAAGKAAEQAGKYQEALAQYVAALQKTPEGTSDEQRLLEAAIRVTQRVTPTPTMPEEARRFSVRGQVRTKEAKSTADFEKAAKEFTNALHLAPWWADAYYNRGVLLEKAAKYDDAIASYKLYLLASPKASDASKVRDEIYSIEVRKDRALEEAEARRKLISPEELGKGAWRVREIENGTTVKDRGKEVTATGSLHFTGNKGSAEYLWGATSMKINGVLSSTSFRGNFTGTLGSTFTGRCEGEVSPDGKSILFRLNWAPLRNQIQQILFDRSDSPLSEPFKR